MGCQICIAGNVVKNHRTAPKYSPRNMHPISGCQIVKIGSPSCHSEGAIMP